MSWGASMGDMSREPSMEDILSSIRRVIARDEAPGPRAQRQTENDDILDLHDEEAAPESSAPEEVVIDDELVSSASAEAARQSLEALSAVITPAAAPAEPPVPASTRTMEDVVLEALRPMLKQWLDTNLPPLVEAMVAKEIRRITGRQG